VAASQQFTRLSQGFDPFGNPILGAIPQSNYIDALVFSGAGNAADNIPTYTDANGVIWQPNFVLIGAPAGVNFFCSLSGTAGVPGASVSNGTASEQNPLIRQIPKGATGVSIAVSAACIVTLSYYF
jgi:hypothetical protein